MKDHEIRETVSHVQDLCFQFRDSQQLRERIANFLVPKLKGALAPSDAAQAPIYQARFSHGWLDVDPMDYEDLAGEKRIVYAAPVAPAATPIPLLAEDHKGMRVDYSGVFKHATTALARGGKEPGLAEMLRQMKEHITELGQRWYAGDTAVVDELLQLYCVEKDARDALVAASGAAQ